MTGGFIANIARTLYDKYGDRISDVKVIFPSRRAGLFLKNELSKIVSKPIWMPEQLSINDVMRQFSGQEQGSQIRLITELYKVYSKHRKEDFDSFYFWGEILLSDFDAVDKYLIDSKLLFRNITDLKEIDDLFELLTPEQIEIVTQFWRNLGGIGGKRKEQKQSNERWKFLTIWSSLYEIYTEFNKRLDELGVTYQGAIYRKAAERVQNGEFDDAEGGEETYVIAGFNALTRCEKVVFDHLQKKHNVDFFWDYDKYYVENREQEAGLFLRENIKQFPQTSDNEKFNVDNISSPKTIKSIAAPSNAMQAKYVVEYLNELSKNGTQPGKESAIVLTDENLLIPVLYSIPEHIDKINVTMGYPLKLTLAYSFVERLIGLQSRKRWKNSRPHFFHSDVNGILLHPFIIESETEEAKAISERISLDKRIYISQADMGFEGELLKRIFSSTEKNWLGVAEYLLEIINLVISSKGVENRLDNRMQRVDFMLTISENINQLKNSIKECGLEISDHVFISLLRKQLQNLKTPYEGEPLEGVQIMGILETRNLDFKNVLILSMNDDNFPGNRATSSSFIPYNLRFGYGLPTPQHHEGVYAYYFYRLLQRAENFHMIYNSQSDEKSSGEQSRYIYQLEYESIHDVEKNHIGLDVMLSESGAIKVEKSAEILQILDKFTLDRAQGGKSISPTALFNYITCPLKFYFHSIAGLKIEEEIADDVDAPMFGTILHRAMQTLYEPVKGVENPSAKIASFIDTEVVERCVDEAIKMEYYKDLHVLNDDFSGNTLLIRNIAIEYINGSILRYDADNLKHTSMILSLEEPLSGYIDFSVNGGAKRLNFFGIADRVEQLLDGRLRVVDYKTGKDQRRFTNFESAFDPRNSSKNPAVVQVMLYSELLNSREQKDIEPNLYFVRSMKGGNYSSFLESKEHGDISSYTAHKDEFLVQLRALLSDIYNPELAFNQCEDEKSCAYCDFKIICKRGTSAS